MERKYASLEAQYRLDVLCKAVEGEDRQKAILAAMEDDSSVVRDRAIALAVRHLEPEILGPLVEDDANAVLRNAALEVLGRQGPYALPFLREMATGANPEVSMFAANVLAGIPDGNSIPVLLELLDHEDENVVLSAIEALGTHRAVNAVPRLCELIRGSLWQQVAVIRALGRIGDAQAVPVIREALSNEMLAEAAVEAMAGIADERSCAALWDLLREEGTREFRMKALLALAEVLDRHSVYTLYPDPSTDPVVWESFLTETLEAREPERVRAAALVALRAGSESVLPHVVALAAREENRDWISRLFRRDPELLQRNLPVMLSHADPDVRLGALVAGAADRASIPLLLHCLTDEDERIRLATCRALGSCRAETAVPALIERLHSKDPDERKAAVEGLSGMDPGSLAPLTACLREGNPVGTILDALAVVEEARCQDLVGEVIALMGSDGSEIRRRAARAAGVLDDPGVEERLVSLLDDPDRLVQVEAVDALAGRDSECAVPRLLSLLRRDDPVRFHAIRALGRMEVAGAARSLEELYATVCTHEQIEIVSALVRIDPPWIETFLRQRFEEGNVEIRRIAAEGLVRIPGALELSDLAGMAEDGDWSIRSFAAWALGRRPGPESGEILLTLVRDVEPLVARIAREALEKAREE